MASSKKITTIFRMVDATLVGIWKSVHFLARFVPPQALLAAADYIGYALYYTQRKAREYILETLRESLPEVRDEGELVRIAKKAFGSPIKAMLDLIIMERHLDTVVDRFIVDQEAVAVYNREKAAGRGVIIFAPHIGGIGISWSMAAQIGIYFTPIVYNPQNSPVPRFMGAMAALSEKLGSDPEYPVFWAGIDAVSKAQEHLRRGKSVGTTFDLGGGTVVDLFGRPTALASGIARIACDSGAVIIPGYLKRNQRPLEYQFVAHPELPYTLTGDSEADLMGVLKKIIEVGETMIREVPEQWIGWLGMRGWRRRAEKMLAEEDKS
jgi:lauroyl/myristoyl acyltransferase